MPRAPGLLEMIKINSINVLSNHEQIWFFSPFFLAKTEEDVFISENRSKACLAFIAKSPENKISFPALKIVIYLNSKMVPEFHWLRQIAATLSEFHWRFWIFLDAIAKAKKLILKSIAQNLKRVSLTKSFLALAMALNLLLSNST